MKTSFKGFGTPHSYSKGKINRVKRILQKDSDSEIGGSGSTQRGDGSNDEQETRNTNNRSEESNSTIPLHLQGKRELRHVYDPAQHRAEWIQGSAIDPDLTALNLVSLEGQAPYERLFYSDSIKRLNTGRLPGWILKKYAHIEKGGWWASGVDPLTGEDELWGCFKPDQPRIDVAKAKRQKYEHPYKASSTGFFLKVTWAIGLNIAKRNGFEHEYRERIQQAKEQIATQKTEERSQESTTAIICNGNQGGVSIHPGIGRVASSSDGCCIQGEAFPDGEFLKTEDKYFWRWVLANPKVEICYTEGVKKSASLLSQGFAAVGLSGIWGGYRKNDGKPCLLPQLEIFAKAGRRFCFCFDQDQKRKTRQTNRKALWCTAKLLRDKGCDVSIVNWEPWIKGCDDLIVAKGGNHFVECYSKALSFEDWQADGLRELTYKPDLTLDSRIKYVGDFAPPSSAKLICLKAPKGSGKTEWLVKVCAEAQNLGQKVLILTHRQQLGQALCSRFGVDYVTELKDSDTKGVFGIGLCFDSLRRNSQARFNPDDWHGCLVILDEVEQSLWHLLSARTEVSKHRVEVLRNFQELIQNTLESDEGKVYLSDADLSDLSIDYIRSLANFPVEPWLVVKEGNPTPWDVTVWETCDELLGALVSHLRMGGRSLVFVDGQKFRSKWGTQNLEAYLAKLFPELRILRIDAESIADPNHPAFGCIDKLNEVLPLWDVAIASPSIETGVSIDIQKHFSSVWDIGQGVVPVPSILQRMARLREPVPRHTWAKGYGIGRIGNGSTSPRKLMASQQTQFKAHVKLLAESEFPADFEAASSFQPQSIRTWAKMAARINLGMVRYRHEIIRALIAEGHSIRGGDYLEVLSADDEALGTQQIKDDLTESRDKIYDEHCVAVAQAPTPDEKRFESLTKKQQRTREELKELRKGELSRRYSEEVVTAELVQLDDDGEYPRSRLHYYITTGREFLPARDKQVIDKQLESGEGELFLPDVNRSLVGGKIKFLEALDIQSLLQQDTEWTNDSQILVDLSIKCRQFAESIKSVLGVGIKEEDSPVAIAQKFLRQCLGLSFSTPVKRGAKGNQQRFYQPVDVPELRQKILEAWLARDKAAQAAEQAPEPNAVAAAASTSHFEGGSVECISLDSDVEVGSTGNIYRSPTLPTENAAYRGELPTEGGESIELANPVEGLLLTLPLCDTVGEFAALVESHPADVVEKAIALADTAPRRRQLESWFQELSQKFASRGCELAQEGEAIASPDWKQKISTYAELLQDALRHGMEIFKALLEPWSERERWEAIMELEERSPDSMAKLMQIEPNWSDLCVAW